VAGELLEPLAELLERRAVERVHRLGPVDRDGRDRPVALDENAYADHRQCERARSRSSGEGDWVWHSLRHVFCTTALFTWKLDPTDVSRMAGHANYRITLDMYVGTTAGVLDRARSATE